MEQDTRFTHTRTEWQRVLQEIAFLSRSNVPVEEFLSRFLQLTLSAAACRGGVVWIPQGREFQPAGSDRLGETGYQTDESQRLSIQTALRDAATNRRPVVVGPQTTAALPNGVTNNTPYPFFFIPIVTPPGATAAATLAILHGWGAAGQDPRLYQEIVAFLQSAAQHAATFLRARQLESLAASTEKLQQLLRLTGDLNGQLDVPLLAITVVNRLREVSGLDRCVLFGRRRSGLLKVLAVSDVEVVDPKSALVQSQLELVKDTLATGEPSLYRKSAPKTEALGDISDYFFHSHANEALGIPLKDRQGRTAGALLVEAHRDQPIDENQRRIVLAAAAPVGRALAAAQEVAGIPWRGAHQRWLLLQDSWRADKRRWLLLRVAIPTVLGLAVLLCPLRFTVKGDCTVLPLVRAEVVAQVPGRVAEVLVREGDAIEAGQPIARLDGTEIRQSLAVAEQEKAKAEAEANRLQIEGEDGGRRIALLIAEQHQREIDLLQHRLANTEITSPIRGVVLTRDLASRVGDMLSTGERFCQVADPRSWEVLVQIPEADVALLNDGLQQGRQLPLLFLLHALADQPLRATIANDQAVSQMSHPAPAANVFIVRADLQLPPAVQTQLKAGYTGRGRIAIGWRPLGYLATRRFINYLRVRWFF